MSTGPTLLLPGLKALSSSAVAAWVDLHPALLTAGRSLPADSPLVWDFYVHTVFFFFFFNLASNYTHMLPFNGEDVTAINLTTAKSFHFLSSSPSRAWW